MDITFIYPYPSAKINSITWIPNKITEVWKNEKISN